MEVRAIVAKYFVHTCKHSTSNDHIMMITNKTVCNMITSSFRGFSMSLDDVWSRNAWSWACQIFLGVWQTRLEMKYDVACMHICIYEMKDLFNTYAWCTHRYNNLWCTLLVCMNIGHVLHDFFEWKHYIHLTVGNCMYLHYRRK